MLWFLMLAHQSVDTIDIQMHAHVGCQRVKLRLFVARVIEVFTV